MQIAGRGTLLCWQPGRKRDGSRRPLWRLPPWQAGSRRAIRGGALPHSLHKSMSYTIHPSAILFCWDHYTITLLFEDKDELWPPAARPFIREHSVQIRDHSI